MVLFASREEINEVFDTFCDVSASNPSDVETTRKPVHVGDIEEHTAEIQPILVGDSISPVRPSSPIQVFQYLRRLFITLVLNYSKFIGAKY